ncbi:MAG: twin-arginine translocation signal domain-containing protein [Abditibacteriales bacterium]|nr:twin-arginine translocation signal domain-containing protein [Abditibacteriales bacterium]MDW8365961.1 twin-arginine translocation signal domain-containing protein [Abditibacteriales bacterium]
MRQSERRKFLKVAGAAAAAGVASALPGAAAHKGKIVQGTSHRGDVQEALNRAIAAAFDRGPSHPDVMLTYEVKSIKGRVGGIAGFNEVTVSILARFS